MRVAVGISTRRIGARARSAWNARAPAKSDVRDAIQRREAITRIAR
jgi:hypothetical protein